MTRSGLAHVEAGRQALTFLQDKRADDVIRRAMECEPGWLTLLCWEASNELHSRGARVVYRALRDGEVAVEQAAVDFAVLETLSDLISDPQDEEP